MKWDEQRLAEGILFTDMYQLTMAQIYFRHGLHERPAQFDHFFRSYPDYGDHKAGYCINAGLEWLLDWMEQSRFGEEEIQYLRQQVGSTGKRLFAEDFLTWLARYGEFSGLTVHAIPEGRVVHPNVPLTIVSGPLAIAQILESALLNQLNYQVLIATKAARINGVTGGRQLLEFGMRRGNASGVNAGARAALIGGADFTSNAGISQALDYPAKGTHAHSMVQVFMALGEGELGAFQAYADLYPDDCILLVDTIDTLESGIPNAIKVFESLRRKGREPLGIRLDSGDLAHLSVQAARMLDKAGFSDVSIVLSNQLDELTIWQIQAQIVDEAPGYGQDPDEIIGRLIYGVGTRLITSGGDSALDGVYKLVAIQDHDQWQPAIKISESRAKVPNPGQKAVWRIYDQRGNATADLLTMADEDPRQMEVIQLHHPIEHGIQRTLLKGQISKIEPLLTPVWGEHKGRATQPSIEAMREIRRSDLNCLDPGVKRLMYPHIYHVSLSEKLWLHKEDLIRSAQLSP